MDSVSELNNMKSWTDRLGNTKLRTFTEESGHLLRLAAVDFLCEDMFTNFARKRIVREGTFFSRDHYSGNDVIGSVADFDEIATWDHQETMVQLWRIAIE
jgi:hypothetical protein